MMKPKAILILLLLLGMLFSALLLTESRRPGESSKSVTKPFSTQPFLPGFSPAAVAGIQLIHSRKSVRLEREKNEWRITSHKNRRVNMEHIQRLLVSLKSAEIIQRRTGDAKIFWLDADNRVSLELFDENNRSLAMLFVGKDAGYPNAFVSLPGISQNEFLEVNQSVDNMLGTKTERYSRSLNADFWYDLRILRGNRREVISFVIEKRIGEKTERIRVHRFIEGKGAIVPDTKDVADLDEPFDFNDHHQSETAWRIFEPVESEADSDACREICSTALPLNVKGFEDGKSLAEVGLDLPVALVEFVMKDGVRHIFRFGKTLEKEIFFQVNDTPDILKADEFVFQNMVKSLEQLKKKQTETAKDAFSEEPLRLAPQAK
jgi:hypothetical protein